MHPNNLNNSRAPLANIKSLADLSADLSGTLDIDGLAIDDNAALDFAKRARSYGEQRFIPLRTLRTATR